MSSPSLFFIPHHNWPAYSPDGFLIMASEVGVVTMLYFSPKDRAGLLLFYSILGITLLLHYFSQIDRGVVVL